MILNNAHDPLAEYILIPIIRYENLPLDRIGGVTGEERKAEAKTEGLVNGVDRS